jgi:hypothetical protein
MDKEKLIILVQGHECLFNLQHNGYDISLVKDNCWKQIAGEGQGSDRVVAGSWQGRGRVVAGSWQGRGRVVAGSWQGRGMVVAWERHGNGMVCVNRPLSC